MEFAKNVLISSTRCERWEAFRFAFLRSDLSCHHVFINLRNLSTDPYPFIVGYSTYVGCWLT